MRVPEAWRVGRCGTGRCVTEVTDGADPGRRGRGGGGLRPCGCRRTPPHGVRSSCCALHHSTLRHHTAHRTAPHCASLCTTPHCAASPHCAVLVWCYLHCVRSASPRLGVGGPCWMVSISERCDAPPGAGNTIPAAKPRSVVMSEVRSAVPTEPRCAMPEVVRSLVRRVVTGRVTRR